MGRQGYRTLAESGADYARRVIRGAPMLDVPWRRFMGDIVIAVRPHFFALPALAAFAGAASGGGDLRLSLRSMMAALICGIGWGVGQLLNDLLDRESDAVNAPHRAIAAGVLPAGPTLALAVLLGVVLLAATALIHPRAWSLAVGGGVLLLLYDGAKRWPLLGNVAHASLMATVAAIGRASVMQSATDGTVTWKSFVDDAFLGGGRTLAAVAAVAAWYLQSNYEKDCPGDRAVGDRTLAVVTSVRTSAALRAAGIFAIAVAVYRSGLAHGAVSLAVLLVGTFLGVLSTGRSLLEGTDEAALAGYHWAVLASLACMLALAAPLFGVVGTASIAVLLLAWVNAAFRRSVNP